MKSRSTAVRGTEGGAMGVPQPCWVVKGGSEISVVFLELLLTLLFSAVA